MSSFPLVNETDAASLTAEIFATLRRAGVRPPRLYRALGHAPHMLKAWIDLAWPLRTRPTVARATRELLIARVAQKTGNEYELGYHRIMAQKAGVADAKFEALVEWQSSAHFSEAERLALQLAEEIATEAGASVETMRRLAAYFTP